MAQIIYGKFDTSRAPLYGKYEYPIRALIADEAERQEERNKAFRALFNVENSKRFAEAIVSEGGLEEFQYKPEGDKMQNLNAGPTVTHKIEHTSFAGRFTVTREMADDAVNGIAAKAKRDAIGLSRSYYNTMRNFGFYALANGTSGTGMFNGAPVDLKTADGLSLFHKNHTIQGSKDKTANRFYGNGLITAANGEKLIAMLESAIANNPNEAGDDTLGYRADTIILPDNKPIMSVILSKIVGSQLEAGSDTNAINTQYGRWNIITLPHWRPTNDSFMVMSSEANEALFGNQYYIRHPLDVRAHVEEDTLNFVVSGYARFGVGFPTWKHIALYEDTASDLSASAQQITIS